ncbi:RNA 2',3'-cyclic phosphodiesterase [Candidatus Pacearchaeota archaeon]|nr:RNA 2',3'-cyclic phosphodiesterase [Candidatus Pacearchaeota archaeon]
MRAFIALELSEEAKAEIERIQKELKKQNLFEGKLTEKENLHLTLKFLGEIDEAKIEEVKKKLRVIKFPAFKAELGEAGVFSEDFVRIVWIKLDGNVMGLQKEVDSALKGLFKPEFRFMSHLTIARVKNVNDKKRLLDYLSSAKIKRIEFSVLGFALKSSVLTEKGPIYSDIDKYKTE